MKRRYEVKSSSIHGKGLFTLVDLDVGDVIGLAVRTGNNRELKTEITSLGLWVNHSQLAPNVNLEPSTKGWLLVAIKNISAGTELVANYRDAPLFIKRPEDYGGGFKP